LQLLFPEPLVVVDPVDKARNVASAVQPLRLYTFVAAIRSFLKKPRSEFFFPPKVMPLKADELRKVLKIRGSALVFLTFSRFEAVPDVLWGQLYRTRKALSKHLELNEFRVLRDGVFGQDKSSFVAFVFELEQLSLASARKHAGPPLEFGQECEHFLKKYSSNKEVLAGPLIDDGRWVVELPRKFTEATELLRVKLGSGGREIGVAELIAEAIKKDFVVLVGAEITEHYVHNDNFAEWLTEFLSGKPFWLKF
jgi:tRNA nucleotidyltransferase (CCA-adding enzyme)